MIYLGNVRFETPLRRTGPKQIVFPALIVTTFRGVSNLVCVDAGPLGCRVFRFQHDRSYREVNDILNRNLTTLRFQLPWLRCQNGILTAPLIGLPKSPFDVPDRLVLGTLTGSIIRSHPPPVHRTRR
jgi:hypothetical protein